MLSVFNSVIGFVSLGLLCVWLILSVIDSRLTFRKHAKWVKVNHIIFKTITAIIAVITLYAYALFLISYL